MKNGGQMLTQRNRILATITALQESVPCGFGNQIPDLFEETGEPGDLKFLCISRKFERWFGKFSLLQVPLRSLLGKGFTK
jgi:hypothetical protein